MNLALYSFQIVQARLNICGFKKVICRCDYKKPVQILPGAAHLKDQMTVIHRRHLRDSFVGECDTDELAPLVLPDPDDAKALRFDALLYNRFEPRYTTLQYEMMKLFSELRVHPGTVEAMFRTPTGDTERAAAYVLVSVPLVIAYPFFQKYFVAGLSIRGVKE